MTNRVCLTIDVEDFYEGLAVLGEEMSKPPGLDEQLDRLVDALGNESSAPKVTLFVVGRHAADGPALVGGVRIGRARDRLPRT